MSTTIYYTNNDDQFLTNQQLSFIKEFKKVTNVNNQVKKIEYYENEIINQIDYYKHSSENLLDIFNSLGSNTVNIITIENDNSYVIMIESYYIESILSNVEKKLLSDSKVICVQDYGANNIPKLDTTVKYIYDSLGSKIGEEIFSFRYNADGSLKNVSGIGYPFSNDNQTLDADEIPLYFPNLLIDNPYYANATFLP
ncbi:hypothetical protein [Flavobacterium sp. RS13.1]|uniref:hypothetical protein n=1 Tax=Flavobacterium sp. RS13.1 TaxID=3400345 RepID=UPI003AAD638D